MTANTLCEQIGLRRLNPDNVAQPAIEHFISTHNPARLGNNVPIAYGGCTLGIAIHAACQSIWSDSSPNLDFRLYSVLGHFLGPALVDRSLACEVSRVRESRSFKTRRAILTQTYDDGSVRECLALTADFMKIEKDVEMEYSAPPAGNRGNGGEYFTSPELGPENTITPQELAAELLASGQATEREVKTFNSMFGLMIKFFEPRLCRDGVGGQNLGGMAKGVRTSQDRDGLGVTEKTTIEWLRAQQTLTTEAENMAALGFVMDGGLSFLPLIHGGEGKFLDDVGACSTLDFSIRMFQTGDEKLEMDKWKLKERRTIAAAGGRTYTEARLWNERGKMMASMTQACILRPKPKERKGDKL